MDSFKACTALITGVSSGIGRELALQLAPSASCLILVARRLDRLEALQVEILAINPAVQVTIYQLDLADAAKLEVFLHWLENSGMKVDFLINNAGVGDHGPFAEGHWDRIQNMLDVNVLALTRVTHSLLPGMIQNRKGAILNVSSVASLLPVPYLSVYAATKAFVSSFSEGLRVELRGTNISVTVLCPGPVPTEFGERATRATAEGNFDTSMPAFLTEKAASVAREGLQAVARDRARLVPGAVMGAIAFFLTLLPLFVIRPFLGLGGLRQKKSA